MSRTLHITAGDRDYVWFTATEITGEDISTSTALVGFSDFDTPPAEPITPNGTSDKVEHPEPSLVRVGLFVAGATGADGAHVVEPGSHFGWIQPVAGPSRTWVRCGPVTFR